MVYISGPNLSIAADHSTFENFDADRPTLDNFLHFKDVMVFIVDCFNKTMLIPIHWWYFLLFLLICGLNSSTQVTEMYAGKSENSDSI